VELLKKAINLLSPNIDDFLVINGDTFFQVDLEKLEKRNQKVNSDITISLKEMTDFDRYGAVKVESNRITKFEEKKFYKKAKIDFKDIF
jgi:NDP-sugar pyrophosphorylase family protein